MTSLRAGVWRLFATLLLVAGACRCAAAPLVLKNDYRSPRNKERPFRKSTRLIVLHTTEAPMKSSLNKLCERGEAHYCVTEKGEVYRIVDRDREAFHAGRSMWNGKEDCDEYSVGIEVVGHHDQSMPLRQLEALKELIDRLKKIYSIRDEQVVCHSQVAYGAPNTWHKKKHRGRKRCGMLFAMPSVRAKLGLTARPAHDPDVKAKRLVQADSYLNSVLYGSVDTMTALYGASRPQIAAKPTAVAAKSTPPKATPPKAAPAKAVASKAATSKPATLKPAPPKAVASKAAPPKTPAPKAVPTKAVAQAKPAPARPPIQKPPLIIPPEPPKPPAEPPNEEVAKEEESGRDWLMILGLKGGYFKKTAKLIVPEAQKPKPKEEPAEPTENVLPLPKNLHVGKIGDDARDFAALAKLPGYTKGGPVSATLSPYKIAGAAWKSPTTYYYSPRGRITTGDKIDEKSVEAGTFVFYRSRK